MKDKTQPQPKRLIKKSYLKCIQNSVGTKMFRNLYLELDDKVFDATKNGELSCAFFVSGLLKIFQLIKAMHGTVGGTIKDLEESGWIKTAQPTPGSVIIWEATLNGENGNEHIGFYVGRDRAISNSSTKKKINIHNWTYNNTRKIKAIYSNPVLIK